MKIKLFGAGRCHKTQHYKSFLETRNLDYKFLDVESCPANAAELRNLYKSGKLNFPTLTINDKKLRNPSDTDLIKWIEKLI